MLATGGGKGRGEERRVRPGEGGAPLARDDGVLFFFSFCLLGAEGPLGHIA